MPMLLFELQTILVFDIRAIDVIFVIDKGLDIRILMDYFSVQFAALPQF